MREVEARLKLSAVDRTAKAFGAISNRLDAVDRKAKQVTRVQSAMARASSGLAMVSTRALAPLATGAALLDIVKTSASFETALTGIAKKGDLSASSLAKVKAEILGIVESGKVTLDPGEIAGAYERGIASGIPISEMREFVTLSAQAADAWDMTGEATGNAFAGFKESLKLAQSDMRPFADLINTLADAGISEERDIVDFIDRAGASLKDFGLQKETIAVLGGTLLDLKMPTEQAATAMNALSTKLLTPGSTKKSAAAFATLYGSAGKFTKLLKTDADGALRDFFGRLQKLDKFKRAELLTDIVGLEHSSKVNRLISSLDLLDNRLATARDPSKYVGSLGKSYDRMLDTYEAKWKVFAGNLEVLKINLGDFILPPAADFLKEATEGVTGLSDTIKGLQTTYETLKSSVTGRAATGDFDPKGTFDNWWGPFNRKRIEAEAQAKSTEAALADKAPNASAVGAMGARNIDGATAGSLLATARNAAARYAKTTHGETGAIKALQEQADARHDGLRGAGSATAAREAYIQRRQALDAQDSVVSPRPPSERSAPLRSYREADTESLHSMKRQFGSMLAPGGESFQRGTSGQDLIDESDVDALRQAIEGAGGTLTRAGETTASGLETASGTLMQAGQTASASIEAAGTTAGSNLGTTAAGILQQQMTGIGAIIGREAAANFNANVKIPMPSARPGALPAANAAPAATMTDADKTGG